MLANFILKVTQTTRSILFAATARNYVSEAPSARNTILPKVHLTARVSRWLASPGARGSSASSRYSFSIIPAISDICSMRLMRSGREVQRRRLWPQMQRMQQLYPPSHTLSTPPNMCVLETSLDIGKIDLYCSSTSFMYQKKI